MPPIVRLELERLPRGSQRIIKSADAFELESQRRPTPRRNAD
jgi:hypothetical protein